MKFYTKSFYNESLKVPAIPMVIAGLFLPALALAQQQVPPSPPSFSQVFIEMMPMALVVFMVFYILVMRPQAQKMRSHAALMESLKKGETVRTTGGVIGRVAAVEKDHILVEIAANVKVKFEREHIIARVEPGSEEKKAA